MPFVPDEPLQAVCPGETGKQPFAMLMDAAGQIARHAEIERAIRPVGHDVDPATLAPHAGRMAGGPASGKGA